MIDNSWNMIRRIEIDFGEGHAVRSRINYAPMNLSVGDVGKITGPCSDKQAADASRRVEVDFGSGPMNVTLTQIEKLVQEDGITSTTAKTDRQKNAASIHCV